eukprot:scaffold25696_cov66-Phaeocystis_antarctica.AAC.5
MLLRHRRWMRRPCASAEAAGGGTRLQLGCSGEAEATLISGNQQLQLWVTRGSSPLVRDEKHFGRRGMLAAS